MISLYSPPASSAPTTIRQPVIRCSPLRDAHGTTCERRRARVRGSEALLARAVARVRCAAPVRPWHAAAARATATQASPPRPARRRLDERRHRVEHRLVAGLRPCRTHDAVPRRGDPGRDRRAVRGVLVAERSAERARATPHSAPEVPPARSAQASPRDPQRGARAGLAPLGGRGAAAAEPRCIPMPWSPSPATASMRPSSSACASSADAMAASAPTTRRDRRDSEEPGSEATPRPPVSSTSATDADGSDRALAEGGRVGRRAPRAARARRRATRRLSETPAMSKLVTSSPTSGSTILTPASARRFATSPKSTNSSSYLTEPRPLSTARPRASATSSGRSASSDSTSSSREAVGGRHVGLLDARLAVDPQPERHPPRGHLEQRLVAPGSVQPENATPKVRVRSLARRASRSTASRSSPRSAAAPAHLEHEQAAGDAAALVRLLGAALATSSVTSTVGASTPAARSGAPPRRSSARRRRSCRR